MANSNYSAKGFYPFDISNDYEQKLITNCAALSFDDYNASSTLKGNFTVMHLNCCSLSSKYDSLQVFLSELYVLPDVICLTESWTSKFDSYYPLQYYNMFNFPREYGKGGGIVIYVKESYTLLPQTLDVTVSSFEFACIQLSVNTSVITLVCVYRPPHTNKDLFCNELENLISLLPSEPNSVIVCGDYNVDALDDTSHFNNLVAAHLQINAYPVIFLPTRTTPTSSTIIDHIFSNFVHVVSSGVFNNTISDHFPIFISVNLQSVKSASSIDTHYIVFRPLSSKGVSSLRNSLSRHDWSFITNTSNVNLDYDNLVSVITNKIDTYLPVKRVLKHSPNAKPWITNGIRCSCKQKSKLYKLVCLGKYSKEQYASYRNMLTGIIRRSKIAYYSSAFNKNAKNPKAAWEIINNLIGKKVSNTHLPANLNGNEIKQFFCSIGC
jgi:hypothetical protein